MTTQATYYIIRALVALVAIPFHEAGHALAAWLLGDATAKREGRLSLNPFAHFDLLGTLCMVFAGVGWATMRRITAPAIPIRRSVGWKLSHGEESAAVKPSPIESSLPERSAPGASRKACANLSKGYTNRRYGRFSKNIFFMFISARSDLRQCAAC